MAADRVTWRAAAAALLTGCCVGAANAAGGARLDEAWKFDALDLPLAEPQLHRPIYLVARHSDNPNTAPQSPTQAPLAQPSLRHYEAKFQLSFKSELLSPATFRTILGTERLRLWIAYTQQSSWQVWDVSDSRPFRNTDYEPEFILTQRLAGDLPYAPRLLNWGIVHQSNGQSDPLSRSWNRLYLQAGWQVFERTSALVRLSKRMDEPLAADNNPDMEAIRGRVDAVLRADLGQTRYALAIRRRFVQVDMSNPVFDGVVVHFQVTSGQGESLIDYNHRQTTIGVGFSLGVW